MSRRVLVVVLGLVGALASACSGGESVGGESESDHHPIHRTYVVEGNIEISPPGPPGVTAPAAICQWANGFNIATPELAMNPEDQVYVVCTLDQPVSVPFNVSRYSTSGSGFLIGAYLVSIPDGHPKCSGSTGLITGELTSALVGICAGDKMPPKSEVALMAPFDDDEGRPTPTVRIAITKAQ